MTLAEYEKRIKACNPKLHIKRYGTSKAGIHLGTLFICRVPQGEINQYNSFRSEVGYGDQYVTDFNPSGKYMWRRMTNRGRTETARILYTQRVIRFSDIAKLS